MTLLLDEQPLLVMRSLAVMIGLNESLFLQQLHYWLEKSNHHYEGCKWVYNTQDEWLEQFPFWSKMTLRRIISSLEEQELIITGNYNTAKFDKTKWYTINYHKIRTLRCVQNEQLASVQNEQIGSVQNEQTYTKEYTKTTTKTTKDIGPEGQDPIPCKEIIDYLNQKANTHYKPTTKKTQTLIKARIKEGFTVNDFKKVIDIKTAEWLNTDMSKFLRPETLFSPKFESYLNQKGGPSHDGPQTTIGDDGHRYDRFGNRVY